MKKTVHLPFYFLFFILFIGAGFNSFAQIIISGTVYDSTKLFVVPKVNVYSTAGATAITDSLGAYRINVSENDSINFFYREKYTVKFPVNKIADFTSFDISIRVRVNEKYKLLKGITVFSDTYKRDSVENRITYSKIFGRDNPTIRSSYEPGGAAGIDINELIGIFQFRKNRQNLAFQQRLIRDEQSHFVDYRFSSKTITRITGLKGNGLLKYKKLYRPAYLFVVTSSLAQFYEYILNTSYAFKKENGIP